MEPTYYWDGLSRDALDWLNRNTAPGKTVQFASYPTSWHYSTRPDNCGRASSPPGPALRRGMWSRTDLGPSAARPRPGPAGRPSHLVRKWGVPLVWIFADGEVERVLKSEEGAQKSTPAQENHSGASSRRGP